MRRSEVQFRTGIILTKEMLQELYDYPRNVLESRYVSYGDGILYGLSWREERSGKHVICSGALKFGGEIYFQSEPFCVEDFLSLHCPGRLEVDGKYRLFFMPQEIAEEPGRKVISLELTLVKNAELESAKQKGFYYSYVRFDGEKGLQVIDDKDCVYGLYAGTKPYGYRLPLYILESMLSTLEEKKNKHSLDYEILKCIYNGTTMPTELAILYVHEYEEQQGRERQSYIDNPKALAEIFKQAVQELEGGKVYLSLEERNSERENALKRQEIRPQGII